MANVNIKFNNKDYLLSCDDGQEESLKNLTKFLDKKYNELKDKLGNIGENKLLLITTIQLIDEYFDLKQRVSQQKKKLDDIAKKFPTSKMWDREFDASLKGSFFMIKFFGEEMIRKKKGSIINIGSDLSVIAPNQKIYKSSYASYIKPVTYAVIKHGMVGLTKYFSSLYGQKNVRVNMVSPGPVKNKQNTKLLSEIENMTPMERLGDPKDILGLLFFLANDDSSYITGQNILVDGGKTII